MTTLFTVDAFTAEPFRGNPAGVVMLEAPAQERWMQAVAAELRHSETAFWQPDGGLRWFTPAVEVPLCGHATLATAHVLWETGTVRADEEAVFATRSGTLRARRDGEAIQLDLPAYALLPAEPPRALRDLLPGTVHAAVRVADLAGDDTWLVELESEAAVRATRAPGEALLAAGADGLVVTARGDGEDGVDVVSRCFFPAAGIDEDPVTGAAHCALAPFWAPRLGRDELTGFQASPRGGRVGMRLAGDRVLLRGQAVTVLRGELLT